jgi:hypothetical protein
MKLEAVKMVRYGSGRYDPGTQFEVDDERHVRVLVASGLAKIPEELSKKPTRRRRVNGQYERRDMVADGRPS